MTQLLNIYCDETCHLENDNEPVMGFGAILCPEDQLARVSAGIADLKQRHRARGELKWEKVSPSRSQFYQELIDWFFTEPDVRFRGWIVESKSRLDHSSFNAGSHDDFYYKMYYYLLEPLVRWREPGEPFARTYHIYLDAKDTRSRIKVRDLATVLRNKKRDPRAKLISRIQTVRAKEVQLMQLTDFLLGALAYRNRPRPQQSQAKLACVKRIEHRARFYLKGSTPPWEEKFNFFTFTPQEPPA
jgi:hypothetical protein